MKVFGIGLQKTGTTTLGSCLTQLGYRQCSYHRKAAWYLRKGQIHRLKEVMDQYDGFDDEPWAHCYKAADELYPDAKFILTVRDDPERWYNSLCKQCDRTPINEHRKYWFGCNRPRDHKEKVIQAYHEHNQEVLEYFENRPNKLLVLCWEKGDGWEKLCDFLGKKAPVEMIPWDNPAPQEPVSMLSTWRIIKHIPTHYGRNFYNDCIRPIGRTVKKFLTLSR